MTKLKLMVFTETTRKPQQSYPVSVSGNFKVFKRSGRNSASDQPFLIVTLLKTVIQEWKPKWKPRSPNHGHRRHQDFHRTNTHHQE